MLAELVWTLTFLVLLTVLVWPLLKKRPLLVPLFQPLTFLTAEIVMLTWFFQGGWTRSAQFTALLGFVFVGLLLGQQTLARRRWFFFRRGGFVGDMDTYDALALALRQAISELHLEPAAVVCRYDGWLGLSPLTAETEKALFLHIEEALADTKWQRRGGWQLFFGVQWLVLCLALVVQYLTMSGGF
ncbi:MAG: hypothetical protein UDB11_04825 [Peptococcaceae bacterium]|nr:hypothetical protein [Peptococcaceae bacterium]